MDYFLAAFCMFLWHVFHCTLGAVLAATAINRSWAIIGAYFGGMAAFFTATILLPDAINPMLVLFAQNQYWELSAALFLVFYSLVCGFGVEDVLNRNRRPELSWFFTVTICTGITFMLLHVLVERSALAATFACLTHAFLFTI